MTASAAMSSFANRLKSPWVWGPAVALSLVTAYTVVDNINIVGPGEGAARVTGGEMVSSELKPDVYVTRPFWDKIYRYTKNTVRKTTTCSAVAADNNTVSVDFRFHYTFNPKHPNFAFNLPKLADDDGIKLIKEFCDAAVGSATKGKKAMEVLNDPKAFFTDFIKNYEWRLEQSNVPFKSDITELLVINAGGLRLPQQIQGKPDGTMLDEVASVRPATPAASAALR
jgi:hypothetical protein